MKAKVPHASIVVNILPTRENNRPLQTVVDLVSQYLHVIKRSHHLDRGAGSLSQRVSWVPTCLANASEMTEDPRTGMYPDESIAHLEQKLKPGQNVYKLVADSDEWWLGSIYFNATPEEFEAVKRTAEKLGRQAASKDLAEAVIQATTRVKVDRCCLQDVVDVVAPYAHVFRSNCGDCLSSLRDEPTRLSGLSALRDLEDARNFGEYTYRLLIADLGGWNIATVYFNGTEHDRMDVEAKLSPIQRRASADSLKEAVARFVQG